VRQDNILVDWQGRAFVTGVGLSKRLNEFAFSTESGSGDIRSATIRWIAPELVDVEETFPTSKSDVWSFGCNMIHVHQLILQYLSLRYVSNDYLRCFLGSYPGRQFDLTTFPSNYLQKRYHHYHQ
jgi:serine/threonine protein kinase